MAIIVEDATGKDDSESYIDVAFFKAYHKDRGVTISQGTSEVEALLRLATEYIDIRWGNRVLGNKIAEDQALVFPTDDFITDPVSLPLCLTRACAEYGFYSIDNDLFLNNDNTTPGVKRILETVGPIIEETEWTGGGLGSSGQSYPKVTKADRLMKSITTGQSGGVIR